MDISIINDDIDSNTFLNIVTYFKLTVVDSISPYKLIEINNNNKIYSMHTVLKSYIEFLEKTCKNYNFYEFNNYDINTYFLYPEQYYSNIINTYFLFKLYGEDNYYVYEIYANSVKHVEYETYRTQAYSNYKRCSVNLDPQINDIGSFINNFSYYLENVWDRKDTTINTINLEFEKYPACKIPVNLIIVRYFKEDKRSQKLKNIIQHLLDVKKVLHLHFDYINLSEDEYVNKINNFILPNVNNLVLSVDSIVSKKFIDTVQTFVENGTIALSDKYNYFTNTCIDLKNVINKHTIFLQNGLRSSSSLQYDASRYFAENFDMYKYGISFIIRAFNEECKIDSVLKYLCELTNVDNEIIIIDNGSTDKTYDIALNYAKKYKHVSVLQYPIKVPKPGNDNMLAFKNKDKNTLASFYNWCFSQTNYSYCIKWDADMIPDMDKLTLFLNKINFKKRYHAFSNNGDNLYLHQKIYYVDKNKSSFEYRLFDKDMFFNTTENCENYVFDHISRISTKINIFKELKPTDDQFCRRSSEIDARDIYNNNIIKRINMGILENNIVPLNEINFAEKNLLICNYDFAVYGGAEKVTFHMASSELNRGKKVYFWDEKTGRKCQYH